MAGWPHAEDFYLFADPKKMPRELVVLLATCFGPVVGLLLWASASMAWCSLPVLALLVGMAVHRWYTTPRYTVGCTPEGFIVEEARPLRPARRSAYRWDEVRAAEVYGKWYRNSATPTTWFAVDIKRAGRAFAVCGEGNPAFRGLVATFNAMATGLPYTWQEAPSPDRDRRTSEYDYQRGERVPAPPALAVGAPGAAPGP